jgi:hypothetical protein
MQTKIVKGFSLKIFYDSIFKISWVSLLTEETFLKVKLPCDFKNYKYNYLLMPNIKITCKIIKTNKNWVLTEIQKHTKFYHPQSFSEYLKLSDFTDLMLTKIKENQDLDTHFFWLDLLQKRNLKDIDRSDFEYELEKNLGFKI